jgi:hypothetical protein
MTYSAGGYRELEIGKEKRATTWDSPYISIENSVCKQVAHPTN